MVCVGIAKYFNIDPTLIRIGALIGTCMSAGGMIVAYFIGTAIMTEQNKIEME